MLESTMDGQPYKAGHHAATLRRLLWREHLGLLEHQDLDGSKDPNSQPPNDCPNDVKEGPEYEFVADPMSDKVWDMWTGNATRNTEIYRQLFRPDPDDNSKSTPPHIFPKSILHQHFAVRPNSLAVKTFEDYQNFAPKNNIKQGHLFDPYMPVTEVRKKFDEIKGHLVWMSLEFLKDAEMAEKGLSLNSYTE